MARRFCLIFALLALLALALPAAAQSDVTPSVSVSDQFVTDTVWINGAASQGPGFVVIHIDANGAPGPVAGFAPVSPGQNFNIPIEIDTSLATPVLYAMLHVDDGTVGQYEFDGQSGLDNPVSVDGQVVTPAFNVAIIDAAPQFVNNGSVTVGSVTTPVDGWLVIHADQDGGPGPVLGQTQVSAGTTADVSVALTGDATQTLWPMLHVDTGAIGTYEFGTVEGADNPVFVNGVVATTPFSTVPAVNADPQVIIHGDNLPTPAAATASFHAHSVLSQGPGWLVIHSDNNGAPGPVLGQTAVVDGTNEEVDVALSGDITPVVWPMLHVDTGAIGTYEFGTVEGADGPVIVNDQVLTFPVAIAPSIITGPSEVTDSDGVPGVAVGQTLIDAQGWLVIHSDQDGGPGPVLGQIAIAPGWADNITVQVDGAGVGTQVWPMLHYDTGAAGVYEFGTVEGADAPVFVDGAVITVPMAITGGEAVAPAEQPAVVSDCRVSARGANNVNVRGDASTSNAATGTLSSSSNFLVDGQLTANGFVWFRLAEGVPGGWVRGDVVTTSGDCTSLPTISTSGEAPAPGQDTTGTGTTTDTVPVPATTPEA